MANTTIAIPVLYGGVSRQAPAVRFPSQVQEADNVLLGVEQGASKRPGSEMKFAVSDLDAAEEYRLHPIDRDASEKYLLIYGGSEIRAFDLDGNELVVVISDDAQAYLVANGATASDLRCISIADYTILLNRTVETGSLTSDPFTVTKEHKDYSAMIGQTPVRNTYHRAKADDSFYDSARIAGYWKYNAGHGTFAKIVFDPLSAAAGTAATYETDGYNPGGFTIPFVRLALALTAATWDEVEYTLTETDLFADYAWREGDQIRLTGGTGVATGWYTIKARINDHTISLTTSCAAAGNADTTSDYIGLYCTITTQFAQENFDDMHEVALAFQNELRKTIGAEEALIGWTDTGLITGYMTITSPFRSQDATILVTEAPAAGYDYTLTTRAFSKVGGEYTVTAGTGTPTADTLSPHDRWTRAPAPNQPKALLDPIKMPIKIVRQFPDANGYDDNLIADNPFAYWRLGELNPGTGDGLTGDYYNTWNLTDHALTRIDTTIDFNYVQGEFPDPVLAGDGYWSARWTGEIKPEFTETYTFKVIGNESIRLWVNNVLLFEYWTNYPHVDQTWTNTIALTAGARYDIKIEYNQCKYASRVELYWSSASQVEQIVPQARLFSSADSGTGAVDEIGNNDGTYIDTPTFGETGAISGDSNTAVAFNGSSEYVNMGTLGNFGSLISDDGLTLEAWIKPTVLYPKAIMGLRDLTGGTNMELNFQVYGGRLEFLVTDNSDRTAWFRLGTPTIAVDVWTHVAVTWHPESPNECAIYVAGTKYAATRLSTEHTDNFGFINFDIDFFVGGENYDGAAMAADYAWSGSLDEVAVYSRVLSPNAILLHYMTGTGDESAFFRVDTIDWTPRLSGDEVTNPLPSIIGAEKAIADVAFHANRLHLASDANLVSGQSGDFFNLFIEDADDIADADPIDAAVPSTGSRVTVMDSVVPFNKAIILFAKGQQFETNAPTLFTFETVAISASTTYQHLEGVRPTALENYLYFPATQKGTTQLLEYFYSEAEAGHKAADVSKHCAGYLPATVQTLAVGINNNVVFLVEEDGATIYAYRYYWDAEKKVQSAWAKYTFNAADRLADIAVIGNNCWLLFEDKNNDYYMTSLSIPADSVPTGWEYLVHLDNRVNLTGVFVAAPPAAGTTTWTLTVPDENLDVAVLGPDFGDDAGTVVDLTKVNSTSYTASGDYSAGDAALGRQYVMHLELSRPYVHDRNGAAILDMTLQLLKLVTNHTNTGQYTIRVAQAGRAARDYAFTPRDGSLLDPEGNSQAFLMGRADDTTISIRDESPMPVTISGGEYAADFTRRSR